MDNKLYFMIGLPRSGKSTLANRWIKEKCLYILNGKIQLDYSGVEHPVPRIVVCGDYIRLALTGNRYNSLTEDYVSAIKYTMIRALMLQGYDVLVDGTHTTKNSILKLLSIDKNAELLYVETTPEECKNRAIKTGQDDLIPVINRMYNNMQQILPNRDAAISYIDSLRSVASQQEIKVV